MLFMHSVPWMNEPIYILSDLHLGHAASHIKDVEQLRPILEGAGTVIFNGDTWHECLEEQYPKSKKLLEDLKALCDQLDVIPVFLPGNHDKSINSTHYLELYEGRITIFHGDLIYPAVSPWSLYYLKQKKEVDLLIHENLKPDATLQNRFDLSLKVITQMIKIAPAFKTQSTYDFFLNLIWPPQRLWTLLRIRRQSRKAMQSFSKRYFPRAQTIVYGHFHHACHYKRNDVDYINTGAPMVGCGAHLVEITAKKVKIYKINMNNINEKPCFYRGKFIFEKNA